ncbi:VPLPA-CTERM sorting domain-containing protein [Pseudooceanicola sp. LIPI14-2-Ac024]|uniref:VPLPA-CTERM sorting domain-containing protein n=1 Tax=Pseudooceanicola sp. LIPI14-2-Ac024 TaxID=3344875 RepID=UPI0035D05418
MLRNIKTSLAAVAVTAFTTFSLTQAANAAVTGVDLGTGAPPSSLGGYDMTAFDDDTRANFTNVTDVASPLGGSLGFSNTVSLREIGSSWATWSHGYTGDVYFNDSSSLTLIMPAETVAFYFYAESNSFSTFEFTVTELGGESITTSILGDGGANGFGFFGTAGSLISSITITTESGASGFAVGEFGVATAAVPLPATALLLVGGLGAIAGTRRRKQRTN